MKADRFNEGKPQLSYIFDAPLAMEGLARRFEAGAKKYSRDNWKRGLDDIQLIDSLLRHIKAYQNGELYDEDGTHIDAIVWNAVVLSEQWHRREQGVETFMREPEQLSFPWTCGCGNNGC